MKLKQKLAALSVAVVALGGAASAGAATITFDNLDTSGPFGGNGTPFTTYSEAGFTASAAPGQYVQSTGLNGAGSPNSLSILTGFYDGATDAVLDIVGSGLFQFDSFDAVDDAFPTINPATFTIQGFRDGVELFSSSGAFTQTDTGQYSTFGGFNSALVDDVKLSTHDEGTLYLDNISVAAASAVSAAPEPAAWALMLGGVGLAGLALRRRQRPQGAALALA